MVPVRTGSKELIREINASLVLYGLRSEPLQTRTDLARRTGLSLPTVSEIVADLLGSGVVEERATGRSVLGLWGAIHGIRTSNTVEAPLAILAFLGGGYMVFGSGQAYPSVGWLIYTRTTSTLHSTHSAWPKRAQLLRRRWAAAGRHRYTSSTTPRAHRMRRTGDAAPTSPSEAVADRADLCRQVGIATVGAGRGATGDPPAALVQTQEYLVAARNLGVMGGDREQPCEAVAAAENIYLRHGRRSQGGTGGLKQDRGSARRVGIRW